MKEKRKELTGFHQLTAQETHFCGHDSTDSLQELHLVKVRQIPSIQKQVRKAEQPTPLSRERPRHQTQVRKAERTQEVLLFLQQAQAKQASF